MCIFWVVSYIHVYILGGFTDEYFLWMNVQIVYPFLLGMKMIKKRFNLLYLNIWKYRKQYNSVHCLWHLLQKLYGCLDWPGFLEKNLSLYLSFCSDSKKYLSWDFSKIPFLETNFGKTQLSLSLRIILMFVRGQPGNPPNFRDKNIIC